MDSRFFRARCIRHACQKFTDRSEEGVCCYYLFSIVLCIGKILVDVLGHVFNLDVKHYIIKGNPDIR